MANCTLFVYTINLFIKTGFNTIVDLTISRDIFYLCSLIKGLIYLLTLSGVLNSFIFYTSQPY